jgi:hypothetical protein
MDKTTFTITPGVVIEHIGHEAIVMLPGSPSVVRVSGEQAHTLRAIEAGHTSGLSTQAVQSLIQAGILVTPTGMSRRSLVTAGVIGAGAGIAVMAMPAVAAASSGEDAPSPDSRELFGGWYISSAGTGVAVFNMVQARNPNDFPAFSAGDVLPPITVDGFGSASFVNAVPDQSIQWEINPYNGGITNDGTPKSGTFTWQGILYQVSFQNGFL